MTTLTALDWLMYADLSIYRPLVVAPKRVVTDTWARECQKWDHLQHLIVSPVIGGPKQRVEALQKDADIYLISRDNVKWLVEYYGRKWPFDVLVLDELSSFKSPQAGRFKALKKVCGMCSRVIGLTGTPAPNGYGDLWAQLYLIDNGERLGRTVTDFRRRYCDAIRYPSFTTYTVKGEKRHEIDAAIKDICVSMTAKDYLTLPPVQYIDRLVTLDERTKKIYDQMLHDYALTLDGKDILGANAAAVLQKLLQIANGAIYYEDGTYKELHRAKLEALRDIVEAANGQPVLVLYSYKSDAERIKLELDWAGVDCQDLEGDDTIRRWNAGEIPVLLAHPASCGHGLNLQQGGHIIVWFGLTWSLELYQQANARLNRQGQEKPVQIYHLIAEGTAEERVRKALADKATTQSALIDCVKAELEAVGHG